MCVLSDLVQLVMEAVYSLKTNVKPIQREPLFLRVFCFEASVHVQASICRVAFSWADFINIAHVCFMC